MKKHTLNSMPLNLKSGVILTAENDGVLKAALFGDIDHHSSQKMREDIDLGITNFQPKLLKLDFGNVRFMDSSGIGLVMGRYKCINKFGGKVNVINSSDRIKRLFNLSGLSSIVNLI